MSGILRIGNSSKAILGVVAIAAIAALTKFGGLDAKTAVEAVTWVVGLYMGATALEDGAKKLKT